MDEVSGKLYMHGKEAGRAQIDGRHLEDRTTRSKFRGHSQEHTVISVGDKSYAPAVMRHVYATDADLNWFVGSRA